MTMTNAKSTPGPWAADTTRQYSSHARVDGGNGKLICSVGNGESPDAAFEEWKANARLIAAAPDLLEAAKSFFILEVETCNCDICLGWAAKLRASIAKAEGGAA